ncbi:MAG: hypothetical protein JW891_02215 [Candidatus Lokiarchaeota archaeon]|nr:hypothetical protein [Candidatus Lokiarchaeota archaeon]
MTPITPIQFLQGAVSLGFTLISLILGILIIVKYFKYKDRQLLLVGLTWILLTTAWWGDSISFLTMTIGGDVKYQLADPIYFFLANAFIPFMFYTWIQAFGDIVLKTKDKLRKSLVCIMVVMGILFEIYFLASFLTDYSSIGTRKSPYYADWNDIVDVFILFASLSFVVTGIIFSYIALEADNREIRLKGKFLLVAFIVFTSGAIIETFFVDFGEIIVVISRLCGIISAISFYIGFVLPRFIKELFIR